MKITLSFLLILSCLTANAHEYFFGFAELQYNEISQKVEGTLVVTTHDLERYIKDEFDIDEKIEKLDSLQFIRVEHLINEKLHLQFGEINTSFSIIGIESMLNGIANIYIESQTIEITDTISFTFDLLMDLFEQQQNKITFRYRDQEFNLTFISGEKNRTIQIK